MIHFVCICGEPFDVPADMAGESLQCPVCLRLVDVPRLSDTGTFEDDGTLRMADATVTPSALGDKLRAFGQQEDMRPGIEAFMTGGTGDPATTPPARVAPRYDPITGELMLPVEIINDDLPTLPKIDTGAPVLGYARAVAPDSTVQRDELNWWALPWRLVTGMSLVAMAILWVVHCGIVVGLMIPGFNVFFTLIAFFISMIIVAHYANTIEDFGPNDKDKVPVLLRSVSLSEDVFRPLGNCLLAVFYSLAPLMIVALFTPKRFFAAHEWVLYAGVAWAMLVFPAALFTAVCGGVLNNLMPQRVLSVVTSAPARYALASAAFWAACVAYVMASALMTYPGLNAVNTVQVTQVQVMRYALDTATCFGYLGAAVYLMHLAAGWMGLIYRKSHEDFDWVLQRHERIYRSDVVGQLMKRRDDRQVPTANQERLKFVREADEARRRGNTPTSLPALPVPPDRRHGGFEVKI